ncbi:retrovirus-related pol polyprotein from transposon TNT 1-94 [Tanacetum coccineum]|uniref:Retrovirus-related pol polyprotein from transposon TNT 1-94 n=1 Tax=Tanacetum coccineum TaxID=301880 RepID=A0ABQ5ALX6_9ASTR
MAKYEVSFYYNEDSGFYEIETGLPTSNTRASLTLDLNLPASSNKTKELSTHNIPNSDDKAVSRYAVTLNSIIRTLCGYLALWTGRFLEDVMATSNSKEIKERSKAKGDDGEGLYVRGRTDRRDSHQSRGKLRSKSRGGRLKCYICQSEDHLKRNCPKNNRKKSTSYVKKDDQPSSSGCSYHMTPRLDILFDFLECDGGSVQLGDNRECKIRGGLIASVKKRTVLRRYALRSGIARHFVVAGTPHTEWGVAERSYVTRTLMDKVTLFINSVWVAQRPSGGSDMYGDILSKVTSIAIEKKKPMEMWSRNSSDYGIVVDFCCVRISTQLNKVDGGCRGGSCIVKIVLSESCYERRDGFSKEEQDWEFVDPPAGQAVRHTSIRVILALTACKDYELEQLDVKRNFYMEILKKLFYIEAATGYEQGKDTTAADITGVMPPDDMLIAEAKKILGMEIARDRSRKILRVSQSGYVSKILNNFRIDNGKPVQMPLGGHFKLSLKDCPVRDCDVERTSKVPYANAVGSLMYLMVCTRPDIAYAVSVVSRYLANSGKNHWEAVKWILKYLRGTANVGLVYGTDHGNHVDVTDFVDSDYAKDPDKGRSITGYAFLVQGCVLSWKATLQHVVALSTTEADKHCEKYHT